MVTQSNRFVFREDGTIWDNHLSKRYSELNEVYDLLQELNNYVFDFEEEITRQSNEISVLIGDLDQDCHR